MHQTAESSITKPAPRRLPIIPILIGIAALALLVYWGRAAGTYLYGFARWVEGLGVWGPAVFILGYIVATVAFVPGLILTLAAGAIFGLARGVAFVFVGATFGSAAAVERGAGYYAVLGLGLAATIAVTLFVTRLARRALSEATGAAA